MMLPVMKSASQHHSTRVINSATFNTLKTLNFLAVHLEDEVKRRTEFLPSIIHKWENSPPHGSLGSQEAN
jgi:hypothetical protein